MAGLFWLSDAQWAVMEPFMPKNQPGAGRVDDRRTISGIVHVIRWGINNPPKPLQNTGIRGAIQVESPPELSDGARQEHHPARR